jgi:hypothetical protein
LKRPDSGEGILGKERKGKAELKGIERKFKEILANSRE